MLLGEGSAASRRDARASGQIPCQAAREGDERTIDDLNQLESRSGSLLVSDSRLGKTGGTDG